MTAEEAAKISANANQHGVAKLLYEIEVSAKNGFNEITKQAITNEAIERLQRLGYKVRKGTCSVKSAMSGDYVIISWS